MKTEITATPDKHILDSIRHSAIKPPTLLAELVDNSLDAGATVFEIDTDGEAITVQDNGNGCSDVAKMLQLGGHKPTKNTQLGCYGVGLKDAAISFGDRLSIETVSNGTHRSVDIDWNELAESGWKTTLEDRPALPNEIGTRLVISKLCRDVRLAPLLDGFPMTFAPAIWGGAIIRVGGREIGAWKLPLKTPEIDETASHPSLPVSFRVRAGRCEFPHQHAAFVLSYRHRVICDTSDPCGEYTPTSRFLAFVELHGNWKLHKNKDGVFKERAETRWLHEQLEQICAPLLERENSASDSVETAELEAEIAESLGCVVGGAKRLGKGPKPPAPRHDPDNTINREVREADVVDEDVADSVRRRSKGGKRGFSLCYDQIPDGMLGRVDVNGSRIAVKLNSDHPFIAANRKNRAAIVLCAHFLIGTQQAAANERGDPVILSKAMIADTFHETIRKSASEMSRKWTEKGATT